MQNQPRPRPGFGWSSLVAGPLLGGALGLALHAAGLDTAICWTAAITLNTAIWWVFESLPVGIASLLPFAALPLAGVLNHREASAALGDTVIVLLMAAFMLSKAIERSGLHERLALGMIRALGGRGGSRAVLAFMVTAGLISMWISNSATTLMMTPIALAVLARAEDPRLAAPLLLGVAYAASIGGVATLIGTPPNLIFAGVYETLTGEEYGFLRWMETGLPVAVLSIPLMAWWLGRGLGAGVPMTVPASGPWRSAERRVAWVFGLTILAWITRENPLGGWATWLGIEAAGESTVAVVAVIVMFLVPDREGGRLLDWQAAGNIPWNMLLLFAGGICIARAFGESGLASLIAESMQGLGHLHAFLLILGICLVVTFLTELTSNTATTTLLMPVLGAAAVGLDLPPQLLMIPAAISASCAFMLPVATAPNAIVYATDRLTIARMAKEGLVLNLIVAAVVAVVSYWTLVP